MQILRCIKMELFSQQHESKCSKLWKDNLYKRIFLVLKKCSVDLTQPKLVENHLFWDNNSPPVCNIERKANNISNNIINTPEHFCGKIFLTSPVKFNGAIVYRRLVQYIFAMMLLLTIDSRQHCLSKFRMILFFHHADNYNAMPVFQSSFREFSLSKVHTASKLSIRSRHQ